MSVSSKTATTEQTHYIKLFEDITGFEFMHQDDMDSGEMTFNEAWAANVRWYKDHTHEILRAVDGLYIPEEED